MKKDINYYNYHATCPDCDGFNTRLSKPLDSKYALCYSCSLTFRLSDEEIKKIKMPYPIPMAVHKDYENLSQTELKYIDNVNSANALCKSNELNELYFEIRQSSASLIEKLDIKNGIIFSKYINDNFKFKNITQISETEIRLIEKKIYQDVLKNGKIDTILLEDISNIELSKLLNFIKNALASNAIFISYVPIIDNIYNNFNNFITNNLYLYNTYTISRNFTKIDYNIFDFTKLQNFYQFIIKNGSNEDSNFNENLSKISKKEMRNIIYSEPLTIIS
jgi:hypothetical protein